MKILIAVDGSAYTKRMLAFIGAHDEWLGPQPMVVVPQGRIGRRRGLKW